jgi:hypothetical protein
MGPPEGRCRSEQLLHGWRWFGHREASCGPPLRACTSDVLTAGLITERRRSQAKKDDCPKHAAIISNYVARGQTPIGQYQKSAS